MTRVTIDLTQTPPTVRNAYDVSVRDILRNHGATWVPAFRYWELSADNPARWLIADLREAGHKVEVIKSAGERREHTRAHAGSAWRDFGPASDDGPEDTQQQTWDDPHGNDYEDPLTRMFQERLRQAKAQQQARAEDPNGFYEKLNEEHQQSAHERAQEAQRQRIKDEFFRKMNGPDSGHAFTNGRQQRSTPPPRPAKGGPRTWADDLLAEAGDLAPVVYKALARVLHPDAGGNTKLMQALNAANDRRKK